VLNTRAGHGNIIEHADLLDQGFFLSDCLQSAVDLGSVDSRRELKGKVAAIQHVYSFRKKLMVEA
jgi:hypothetical protein